MRVRSSTGRDKRLRVLSEERDTGLERVAGV